MFLKGAYAENKAISLGLPILFLGLLLFFYDIDSPSLWWILIVCTHTLGYTHFVLGFFYQCKALRRKQEYKKMLWFFVLTAAAVSFSVVCIYYGYLALLSVIAILYFVIHGTLNELTLMRYQLSYAPHASLFLPIVFYVTPFFLLSLTHPSFFFTPQLEFLNPPPMLAVSYLNTIISVDALTLVAFSLFGLFVALVPGRLLFEKKYIESGLIFSVTLVTLLFFLNESPLNYIVLYFIALVFHFISWSLYFGQVYKEKAPQRLPGYIRDHLYILVPLTILSVAVLVGTPDLVHAHQVVFNGMIFVTFAMVHNTTSFLNEAWFLKIIKC
jgi:hypothetical protein